jgi:hypothetical protein
VGEREECQHHAGIERADQQLFRGPDVRLTLELRRTADDDAESAPRLAELQVVLAL